MNYIISIIKKYRLKNANELFLKDFLKICLVFTFLFLFFSLVEFIYYLEPKVKIKIFNFYLSSLFFGILFITTKWVITIKSFFNYKNDNDIAKEIWEENSHIKDKLLNIIQINKQKDKNNSDLRKYALRSIESDLRKYLRPKPINYSKNTFYLYFGILLLIIILIFTTPFENALYRFLNYKKEYTPPLPFTLTSLTGDFTGLSGDTLNINISGLGSIPDSIDIYWMSNDSIIHNSTVKHRNQIYNHQFINLNKNIIYWAEYKNYSFFSAWEKIRTKKNQINIKKRPIMKNIYFEIEPPTYTNIKPYIHNQTNINQIQILKGSHVNIQGTSTKNLQMAWMVNNNNERINFTINENNIYHDFIFDDNINIALYCLDNDLISNINPLQFSLIQKIDNSPNINIQSPSYEFELNESLTIPIGAIIYDDYGLNDIWIEYKIKSQDIVNNNPINKIFIKQKIKSDKQFYIDYNWDVNNLGILMGDEIHFWVCANDRNNITGPGITKSTEFIGKFPSLEDLFTRVEEYEDDIENIADDIEQSLEEISDVTEEIILESLKTNDLSWEQEKKLEKTFNEANEIVDKIKDIQDNINEILEQNNDNNLFDSDLLEKFDQFNELLQNMMTDELMDAISKLQDAFKNLDQNKLMEALKNYEFNIEQFEEEIDRFIDMFELAMAEQKLNELSEQIENMINKQTNLIENINNNKDQYVLEKKSKKQENRFSQFENILNEAEKELKNISENTSEQLSDLLNSQLKNETDDLLKNQTNDIQQNNNNSKNKEFALSNLNDISSIINEISNQFKNETTQKMTKEFIIIIDNLLTISNHQEKINLKSKEVRSNSPEIRAINKEQNNIDRSINQINKQLINLSNQTFFVDPIINRNIGKLKSSITKTIANFEQKKIGTARKNQLENLKYINEITFLLLLSMEEMQNSSSTSGFEKFMESLEKMSEQQQGINQGTMQLSQMGMMQQQSILDQLMQQQQQLKEQLEELLKNNPGEDPGGLPGARQDMEEIIKDFKQKNISRKTIERQEKILSKMIESQKSLTKKDFSEKRKNKISEDVNYSGPNDLAENLGNKDLFLINAMESAVEEGLSDEYKKLIRLYFLELQKDNHENK